MQTAWQEYASWNRSVADALFPERADVGLVFMDLEGTALASIARGRAIEVDDVVPALTEAVRNVLDHSTLTALFSRLEAATKRWGEGDCLVEPPALGLLAIFALAAERMQRGDGVASSNYYVRLSELLNTDRQRVAQSYRDACDTLWDSLVTWLDYNEGRRGEPVRFSVGANHYIGRAKAQALIRDADRRGLEAFFQHFDLMPHEDLRERQLEPLLHSWLTSPHVPSKQLAGLWEHDEVRPHLVAAVRDVLQNWDGEISRPDPHEVKSSHIRLTMSQRSLRRSITISLVLDLPESAHRREATLAAEDGPRAIALVPVADRPGEMTISNVKELLSAEAMLGGVLKIQDPIAGTLERLPRQIIVLRKDELSGLWREVSQVRLGDAISILARADIDLSEVLGAVSGTSWTVQAAGDLQGLPQGWNLIKGVTVSGRPPGQISGLDDLQALVPITATAFEFTDGTKIPVTGRVYHCDDAPVVTVGAGGDPFDVMLFELSETALPLEEPWRSTDGAPVVLKLRDLELDAGTYGIHVRIQGQEPDREEFVLVRSGDLEELNDEREKGDGLPQPPDYESIRHDVKNPLFAICRGPNVDEAEHLVFGIPLFEDEPAENFSEGSGAHVEVPVVPWWKRERRERGADTISIPIPGPDSCLRTGRHYEIVEQTMPDKQGNYRGTSLGVCAGCGRTRRYSNSYWRNHRRWLRSQGGADATSSAPHQILGEAKVLGTELDWDLALDVMVTLGGGDARLLNRVTRLFDPSARFYHEFTATLEGLGHIEVQRNTESGEVEAWETAPTTVIDDGRYRRLIGHWSWTLLRELRRAGLPFQRQPQRDAPSVLVSMATVDQIRDVVPDAHHALHPGHALARVLPSLSTVVEALPLRPIPNVLKLDRYHPHTDSWRPVDGVHLPGAYRTGGYQRTYFLVGTDDVSARMGRIVTVATAKHAAPLYEKAKPMMAYSAADEHVIVPLGARLPGMYGRALTLASGTSPYRRDVAGRGSYVVYPGVAAPLAQHVAHVIGS